MFAGRKLVIATHHQKEKAIGPVVEKELGFSCFVPEGLNTDAFGTFSGEVERKSDPLSTAREKCLKAMSLSGCDAGIASEGSFGPHPGLIFIPADEEWLIFMDKKYQLEITVRDISTETNFKQKDIHTEEELLAFAQEAQFPSHGLILRPAKNQIAPIHKGIHEEEHLLRAFHELLREYGSVYAETDMRAMHNPSRMKVIGQLTGKLVQKIRSRCPACGTPGFGIEKALKGLPCSRCGLPTASIRSYLWQCTRCNYEQEVPHQKTEEDPMYCSFCNP